MPTAEILSQGDEVVTGQTVDSNAAWLSERLTGLGFTVVRHTTVGDRVDHIRDLVLTAAQRSELCVCTGGLGPTADDLTAEAVSAALDRPLFLDEAALAHIESLYARFERTMPGTNRKQALLPAGATRFDNHRGTAPGFAIEAGGALLAFFPGVPHELYAMFEAHLLPMLQERFELAPGRLITLRTTGLGESNLQQRIGSFAHEGIVLGFRTCLPENHVKLRVQHGVPELEVRAVVDSLRDRLGATVFGVEGLGEPGGGLVEVVGRALVDRGETLATAESCTGGRLAALCTSIPGSSAWFREGAVTYANAAKVRMLGVEAGAIEQHGAVSEPVARQMARGIRARAGADHGLGTTGVAGPSGGTEAKPVGTVHLALATASGVHHRKLCLPGDRNRIQDLAASAALDLLRRHLQGAL